MLAFIILIFPILFTLYRHSKQKNPEKILNVYAQPGKWFWLKFFCFYCFLLLRKLKAKVKKPYPMEELERMKRLSTHEKAFDATFFHATTQAGIYICGGIERRHSAKANGLLYIAVPELGLLESPKLPKTLLDADPGSVLLEKEYAAEGICFAMVEPMKKWQLSYKGKMRLQQKSERFVEVDLQGEWTTDFPYFLFETDVNVKSLAKAIARESWTEEFFKALQTAHQTHYEQMGYFKGSLTIDNVTYFLDMQAFRDHSFGYKRDWTLMHRYVFHMFYLEDGTRASIGIVSQPATTSALEMGYIVLPDKNLHTIEDLDLVLYQHGENGTPPKSYAFSFRANRTIYEAKISVVHESFHFKGNDIEAKLIERFVDCELNAVKGKGISEWHYNNLTLNQNKSM